MLCWYLTIILDRIGSEVIAFLKIIESILIREDNSTYIVQKTKTNCHHVSVKKEWVFFSMESANQYIVDNQNLINDIVEKTKEFGRKNFL